LLKLSLVRCCKNGNIFVRKLNVKQSIELILDDISHLDVGDNILNTLFVFSLLLPTLVRKRYFCVVVNLSSPSGMLSYFKRSNEIERRISRG